MAAVLQTSGLSVRYGKVRALAPLTVELEPGTWALLGPNGAGKSTLIRAMLGLTRPSGGFVRVLGRDPLYDPSGIRKRTGYMPESPGIIPGLSGIQYVTLAARLNGLAPSEARKAAHVAIDEVGLGEARYRKLETYSTGMRQRAKLAQAIAHEPELLILDEPTNGLDPEGREDMLELIRNLQTDGRSLIVSSHILPEVRQVCDHALIIRSGKVVHQGPFTGLDVQLGGFAVETVDAPGPFVELLEAAGHTVRRLDDRLVIEDVADLKEVLMHANRAGVALRSARPHQKAEHDAIVDLMEEVAA